MFVITGGGSGIGKALAEALVHKGHYVSIIGRSQEKLEKTQKIAPDKIKIINADLADINSLQTIKKALAKYKSIQGLVNNAGTIKPIKPIVQLSESEFDTLLTTNLKAPLFLTQLLYPKLKNGRVLNISSGAAHFPVSGWSLYCASKAALSMLTRSFALECKDVAFSSVMPGIIDTKMQELIRTSKNMESGKREFFQKLHDENKLIQTDVVASFLCWLLCDVKKDEFVQKEWDIYDTSHHKYWKNEKLVPPLEE